MAALSVGALDWKAPGASPREPGPDTVALLVPVVAAHVAWRALSG
jgi:hypothetical protein